MNADLTNSIPVITTNQIITYLPSYLARYSEKIRKYCMETKKTFGVFQLFSLVEYDRIFRYQVSVQYCLHEIIQAILNFEEKNIFFYTDCDTFKQLKLIELLHPRKKDDE